MQVTSVKHFFCFQNFFCPDKKSGNKFDLPSSLVVLTESSEAANVLLTQQVSGHYIWYT